LILDKRPQGIPEWQANLFADYDLSALTPGLFANGGLYYSGDKAVDIENTWMADSYTRVDAGLRYVQMLSDKKSVVYRLNIENLTDKVYLANTSGGQLLFGAPRTARASVTFNF
jgi:iron complex outermembrane recepter protein